MKACRIGARWVFGGFIVVQIGSGCTTGGGASHGRIGAGEKGAPWTILCLELSGPFRQDQLEQVAETLRRTPGIRAQDVFSEHGSGDRSALYYGTYPRRKNKSGQLTMPEALRRDFELVRQLADEQGRHYFVKALIVRKPQPDVGDARWALTQAPGVYSLQVAAFEPTDDFWEVKQAAADYCQWLRGKGYEAYYHHGPACSIVTVGSFGAEAVIPSDRGLPRYSAEVVALQRDPLLAHNLVNGGIVRARPADSSDVVRFNMLGRKGVQAPPVEAVPVPSRLVPVPGRLPASAGGWVP
jgi:hypothetical protein